MRGWQIEACQIELGLNLLALEEFDRALKHFSKLVMSEPDKAVFHYWRGYAYREAALASQITHRRFSFNRGNFFHFENTEKSIKYFHESNESYRRCRELWEKG